MKYVDGDVSDSDTIVQDIMKIGATSTGIRIRVNDEPWSPVLAFDGADGGFETAEVICNDHGNDPRWGLGGDGYRLRFLNFNFGGTKQYGAWATLVT